MASAHGGALARRTNGPKGGAEVAQASRTRLGAWRAECLVGAVSDRRVRVRLPDGAPRAPSSLRARAHVGRAIPRGRLRCEPRTGRGEFQPEQRWHDGRTFRLTPGASAPGHRPRRVVEDALDGEAHSRALGV